MGKSKKTLFLILALLFLLVLIYYIFNVSSIFELGEKEILPVDAEGNIYETVEIGDQVWFAENLRTSEHSEGESWCYNDEDENCEIYGRLYNWEAAIVACPSGWLLPSDEDWQELEEYAGGEEVAGANLKSTDFWQSKDEALGGLDGYDFSVLPGGQYVDGYFYDLDKSSFFWTSTEQDVGPVWSRTFLSRSDEIIRSTFSTEHAFSVRCIKDDSSVE